MKNILLIIAVACSISAQAQTIDVFYTKGDVVVKSGSALKKVSTSTKLVVGDVLQLKVGATVILLQEEKALVLKDENELAYTDLLKKIAESKRSVSDRYISYLWQKTHEEKSQKDDEGNGKMNVTGMVTRGESSILFPADSSRIISNAFLITVSKEILPGYLIIYKKKKPLFSISINQESTELENIEMINKDEWYGLEVKSDKAAPTTNITYVKWANSAEKKLAQDEMRNLLEEINDLPEEVQKEMIAAFFAVNKYVNMQTK